MSRSVTNRHEVGLTVNNGALVLVGGAVGLGFYLYYKAKQTVKETAEALDPTNANNAVNTFAKKIAGALTGQDPKDVSFAPNVPVKNAGPDVFTMTQAQKLAWLDKELARQKTLLMAAPTAAARLSIGAEISRLTVRRKDVAAGKP